MDTGVVQSLANWIAATSLSETLKAYLWIIPTSQSIHILAVSVVFVCALMIGLRLLGLSRSERAPSMVIGKQTRLMYAGHIVLLLTGAVQAIAAPASADPENEYEQWGFYEEYGEFVAAPEELATASVNEIVKSIRLNGQATRLGEAVYARHCAECHGPDLKGLPGRHVPDLTDDTWRFSGDDLESVGADMLPSDVEWTVRYGVRSGHPYSRGNDSGMLALDPAFRSEKDRADFGSDAFLSAAEIEDMVEYVLQLSGQPHDAAGARRAAPLFQDNAKGNCFDCHGMDGTGLAIFGSTNLTRKDQYLYGSDRAAIRESIIKGRYSVMPGFEGVLKEEELKAVSVYVHWGAAK